MHNNTNLYFLSNQPGRVCGGKREYVVHWAPNFVLASIIIYVQLSQLRVHARLTMGFAVQLGLFRCVCTHSPPSRTLEQTTVPLQNTCEFSSDATNRTGRRIASTLSHLNCDRPAISYKWSCGRTQANARQHVAFWLLCTAPPNY